MKYNFSTLSIKTIDGKDVTGVDKTLGTIIYNHTKDLGLVIVAQKIYSGEEVEINEKEVEEIKRMVQDDKNGFYAFVQKSILDYLDNK